MKVKIKKLNENAKLPTYGSPYSAGADLYACIENDITIEPNQTVLVKTGLAMELSVGYVAVIYDKIQHYFLIISFTFAALPVLSRR